nr:MAG TPA: hypothetical protein [Caudoviricetes sp.]
MQAVHPRLRGELAMSEAEAKQIERFIPACAGNSAFSRCLMRHSIGSSPLARGTLRTTEPLS